MSDFGSGFHTVATLREALPGLLRASLTVPDQAVAVGSMLWCDFESGIRPAPQFVAYLPAGHVVDAPIAAEKVDLAQAWADEFIASAAQLDPRAAEDVRRARLVVYAPLGGGPDWVDLWFGDAASPWRLPSAQRRLAG